MTHGVVSCIPGAISLKAVLAHQGRLSCRSRLSVFDEKLAQKRGEGGAQELETEAGVVEEGISFSSKDRSSCSTFLVLNCDQSLSARIQSYSLTRDKSSLLLSLSIVFVGHVKPILILVILVGEEFIV